MCVLDDLDASTNHFIGIDIGIDLKPLEYWYWVLGIDLGPLEVLVLVLTFYKLVLLTSVLYTPDSIILSTTEYKTRCNKRPAGEVTNYSITDPL